MIRHTEQLIASLAALAASAAGAQAPAASPNPEPSAQRPLTELAQNDVFFTARWFRGNPSEVWSAMCGFAIHGNYLSHDVPRPVWELNIEEFMAGATPVIAVSGGAFEVVSKDTKAARKPRAPITALSFTMEGEQQPLTARLVGQPNGDNAVKALLETAPAQRLLLALYDARLITISIGYQDGTTELLRVRNWKDRSHVSGFEHYLQHCTRLLHPLPPGVRSDYRIDSPPDL